MSEWASFGEPETDEERKERQLREALTELSDIRIDLDHKQRMAFDSDVSLALEIADKIREIKSSFHWPPEHPGRSGRYRSMVSMLIRASNWKNWKLCGCRDNPECDLCRGRGYHIL